NTTRRRRGGQPRPIAMQGRPPTAAAKAPCKGVIDCGQGQPVREADGSRKGRQTLAVARRGGACGQKCRRQGLLPVASRGNTCPRPVRRGAAPMEVPPSGAKPATGRLRRKGGKRG
ncbi:hypothetical protein GW17_00047389, partial [Ensete ventricosum]